MTGMNKLPLLVIGDPANSCSDDTWDFPALYCANQQAWITPEIFTQWLFELDTQFGQEGQKVAILLDKCSSHPKLKGLANIELLSYSQAITGNKLPLNQGVIGRLKFYYRKQVVQKLEESGREQSGFQLTITEALAMLQQAWENITPSLIQDSFRKAGFCDDEGDIVVDNIEDDISASISLPGVDPRSLLEFLYFNEDLCTCSPVAGDLTVEVNKTMPNTKNDENVFPAPSESGVPVDQASFLEFLNLSQYTCSPVTCETPVAGKQTKRNGSEFLYSAESLAGVGPESLSEFLSFNGNDYTSAPVTCDSQVEAKNRKENYSEANVDQSKKSNRKSINNAPSQGVQGHSNPAPSTSTSDADKGTAPNEVDVSEALSVLQRYFTSLGHSPQDIQALSHLHGRLKSDNTNN